MKSFKVGDRVSVDWDMLRHTPGIIGELGELIPRVFDSKDYAKLKHEMDGVAGTVLVCWASGIGVQMDKPIPYLGHNCGGNGAENSCRYISRDALTKIIGNITMDL